MEFNKFLRKFPDFFIKRHKGDPETYSKAQTLFWYTSFWTIAYIRAVDFQK